MSSIAQAKLFTSLDIVIGPHGAGFTNLIFMLPNSGIFEIFPPQFYNGCYENNAKISNLIYVNTTAIGEVGKECKINPNSNQCRIHGKKDRNFNVSSLVFINKLKYLIPKVWKQKYGIEKNYNCLVDTLSP